MESKKISFGFKKTLKVEKPVIEDRKDYIECVEEKSIKIVGGEEVKETAPLIIPLKPNTLMTAERLKEIGEKIEKAIDEPETTIKQELQEVKPDNETLDQMAVRELLQDAKKEFKIETQELTVPIPSKPVMEGKKESTLEDYEAIPVQDFGLAMLRGMGWTPNKNKLTYKQPQLRPKGLGLGADKVITENQKKKSKESKEEELALVENSFVLITSGKYNGYYGKVVSLDEENGRVMVDITVKKETVSLSEFMLHPVTKAEYDKESKVINADKFAEYKKSEKLTQPKQKDNSPNRSSKSYDENRPESIRIETSNASSRREKDKRESSTPKRNYRRGNSSSSDRSEREKRDNSPINAQSNTRDRRRSSSNPKRRLNTRDRSSSSDRHNLEKHSSKSNKSKYSEKRERNRSTSNSKERSRYKKRDTSSSEDRSRGRRKEKRDISSDKEVYSRETRKSEMKYRSKQRDSSSSEDRSHNRQKERYKSPKKRNKKDRYRSDSLSSLSGSDIRRKDKKNKRDSDSEEDYKSKKSSDGKRDIDKKRKGKKKKRDRDRSPNYRKHKK